MIDHKLTEAFKNLVLGYEIDLQKHIALLEVMNEEIYTVKCEKYDIEAPAEGKLKMHKNNNH